MSILTTPCGSTSSKCLILPLCIPLSTYCPGLFTLSLTKKSPSAFIRNSVYNTEQYLMHANNVLVFIII